MRRFMLLLFSLIGIAFADDPAYYTDVMTALAAILVMVGAVLGSKVAIELVPITWKYIAKIINR